MTAGVRHSHLPRKLLRHRCRAGRPAVDAPPYGDCARMLMARLHRRKSHRLQLLCRVVQRTPAADLALLGQRTAEVVAGGNLDRPEVRRHHGLPALSKSPADDCAPCGERAAVILARAHPPKPPRRRRGFAILRGAPALERPLNVNRAGMRIACAYRSEHRIGRVQLSVMVRSPTDEAALNVQRARMPAPRTGRRHGRHDARRGFYRLLRQLRPFHSQRHCQPQQQPKNPEPHHRRATCLAAAAYRIVLLPKSGRGAGTLPGVAARCAMGGRGEIRRSAVCRRPSTLHPPRRTPRSQPSCGWMPR